jgi:hypothetical protein
MADDLVTSLRFVLHTEPALDLERMDLKEYIETRDPKLVMLLPGKQARWFTVRPLDVFEMAHVKSLGGTMALAPVLMSGLEMIEEPSGETLRPKKETENSFGKSLPRMSTRELQALFVKLGNNERAMVKLSEVADVILERADLGNDESSGGASGRFTLLPQYTPALERSARLRAEATRKKQETQNSD